VDEPLMLASAPCCSCGHYFFFDVDRVQTVLIDPATGRPPDVDEAGHPVEPEPGAMERSEGRPMCPKCAILLNGMLRQGGQEPRFDETDTSGVYSG
jgi:hypothetical protein